MGVMGPFLQSHSPQDEFRPNWQLKSIFGVVGLLNFVAALDATPLSVVLPTISNDLDGTATEAFWAGTSFLVASCIVQPVFSLASDIFGRKMSLLTAVAAFTLGSILAAVASGLLPDAMLTEVLIADLTTSVSYLGCFLHGIILCSGIYYLPLYYKGTLGYSPVIAGVAFQNRIKTEFHSHPELGRSADAFAQDASSLVHYTKSLPAESAPRCLIAGLYADALSIVWVVMCGAAGLGLISSLLTKGYSMNQSFNSDQDLQSARTTDVESNVGVEFEKTCD
ncbi:hypothetical protein NUU61_007996 [Penicillium alfredii]|uniref:Major facilitator superfamily (MFS) profile domain-containing protein n=1 Tax=Penicillium alfredii TaxID=1506179 RepID=A0A9W9ERR4_9EURO|nr:uncharacterized protein NUU61_007996 [Penicillium alfredii]KAJ5086689.1 hypothetical protein NUU61_007996 [Penicillium alfredii]